MVQPETEGKPGAVPPHATAALRLLRGQGTPHGLTQDLNFPKGCWRQSPQQGKG